MDLKEKTDDKYKLVSWPTPQDYQEAIQMPSFSILDPDLSNCIAETDNLGLPRPRSGNFATVYSMHRDGQTLALRCFLQNVAGQEQRYSELSKFIMNDTLEETVTFHYISEGILIKGQKYPILKMEWVDGLPLDHFIDEMHADKQAMYWLLQQFVSMVLRLKHFGIAHGDLQHGNILVTEKGLRLVDYDGMYVPNLHGLTSNELGHRNYQHPKRTQEHFGPFLDHFSAWVIYASIEALIIDPSLWRKLNGGDECLLFRRSDFDDHSNSQAFDALKALKSTLVQDTLKRLTGNCEASPQDVLPFTADAKKLKKLKSATNSTPEVDEKTHKRIAAAINTRLQNPSKIQLKVDSTKSTNANATNAGSAATTAFAPHNQIPASGQTTASGQIAPHTVSTHIHRLAVNTLPLLITLMAGTAVLFFSFAMSDGPTSQAPVANSTPASHPPIFSAPSSPYGQIYSELQTAIPAEEQDRDKDSTDARALFARGQELRGQNEYLDALKVFNQAYKHRAAIPEKQRDQFARECLSEMAGCINTPGVDLQYRCNAMAQNMYDTYARNIIRSYEGDRDPRFTYFVNDRIGWTKDSLERGERVMVMLQMAQQNIHAVEAISKIALQQYKILYESHQSIEADRIIDTLEMVLLSHRDNPIAAKISEQIKEAQKAVGQ